MRRKVWGRTVWLVLGVLATVAAASQGSEGWVFLGVIGTAMRAFLLGLTLAGEEW